MILPRLEKTNCRILTICGQFKERDSLFRRISPKKKVFIGAYKAANQKIFVRAFYSSKKRPHLHIDCARKDIFPRGQLPKTNIKKIGLIRILDKSLGLSIDIRVCGEFQFPLKDLPEQGLIRSISVSRKAGDISIKLVKAELKIEGVPLESISWQINDKTQTVIVFGAARRHEKIDDQYLVRQLEWLKSQIALFIGLK